MISVWRPYWPQNLIFVGFQLMEVLLTINYFQISLPCLAKYIIPRMSATTLLGPNHVYGILSNGMKQIAMSFLNKPTINQICKINPQPQFAHSKWNFLPIFRSWPTRYFEADCFKHEK